MIYLDCSYIFRDPAARAGLQRVTRCIAQEAAKLRGDVRWAALTESGAFVTLSAIPQISHGLTKKKSLHSNQGMFISYWTAYGIARCWNACRPSFLLASSAV